MTHKRRSPCCRDEAIRFLGGDYEAQLEQERAKVAALVEALQEVREASMAYDHSKAAMTRVSKADRSADRVLSDLSAAGTQHDEQVRERLLSVERIAEALTEAGLTTTLEVGRNWAVPLRAALLAPEPT
jgi:hypothetical protein